MNMKKDPIEKNESINSKSFSTGVCKRGGYYSPKDDTNHIDINEKRFMNPGDPFPDEREWVMSYDQEGKAPDEESDEESEEIMNASSASANGEYEQGRYRMEQQESSKNQNGNVSSLERKKCEEDGYYCSKDLEGHINSRDKRFLHAGEPFPDKREWIKSQEQR